MIELERVTKEYSYQLSFNNRPQQKNLELENLSIEHKNIKVAAERFSKLNYNNTLHIPWILFNMEKFVLADAIEEIFDIEPHISLEKIKEVLIKYDSQRDYSLYDHNLKYVNEDVINFQDEIDYFDLKEK